MAGKGSGWHGESRRHSLARKGVKTTPQGARMKTVPKGRIIDAYGIKFDAHGQPMVAEGILGDLWDKAKSTITQSKLTQKIKDVGGTIKQKVTGVGQKIKETGAKIKEKVTPSKDKVKTSTVKADHPMRRGMEIPKETPKGKHPARRENEALAKQMDKVERQKISSTEEELEQASHFGRKPSKEEVDIDNKGRVGALKSKIASEEKKVPREQLTDMPEEVFESPDADSLIAIAENSEKLIDYKNELQYDINMIKTEAKRLKKRFETDERKEIADLNADRDKARANFKKFKDNIKMSGMDESKAKHKTQSKLNELKQEFEQRKVEIGALKMRNKVTIDFLNDLTDDLTRNVVKMDKKVKQMTASGKVK